MTKILTVTASPSFKSLYLDLKLFMENFYFLKHVLFSKTTQLLGSMLKRNGDTQKDQHRGRNVIRKEIYRQDIIFRARRRSTGAIGLFLNTREETCLNFIYISLSRDTGISQGVFFLSPKRNSDIKEI